MRRIRKLLKVVDDLLYIGELERAFAIYRSGKGYMLQKISFG
jgi:hypothetical protein